MIGHDKAEPVKCPVMAQSPLENLRETLPVKRTSSGVHTTRDSASDHRFAIPTRTTAHLPTRPLDIGIRLNAPVSPELEQALHAVVTHARAEGFNLADTKSLLDIAHNECKCYSSRHYPVAC